MKEKGNKIILKQENYFVTSPKSPFQDVTSLHQEIVYRQKYRADLKALCYLSLHSVACWTEVGGRFLEEGLVLFHHIHQ